MYRWSKFSAAAGQLAATARWVVELVVHRPMPDSIFEIDLVAPKQIATAALVQLS